VASTRELILGRVRAAVRDAPPAPAVPRDYRTEAPGGDPVALFAQRVGDYRATVHRGLGALEPLCRGLRLVVPAGLPARWRPAGADLIDDHDLPVEALDAAGGVLTGCALAIAETGTIALDAGARQGRRAITLVPDLHVCVVEAAQIVATVPEAIARLGDAARAGRPITLISGPSATSDIELRRVEGVHGPRRLEVVIV
jgi:L-lactate dehydrogenase complex protein LldG